MRFNIAPFNARGGWWSAGDMHFLTADKGLVINAMRCIVLGSLFDNTRHVNSDFVFNIQIGDGVFKIKVCIYFD